VRRLRGPGWSGPVDFAQRTFQSAPGPGGAPGPESRGHPVERPGYSKDRQRLLWGEPAGPAGAVAAEAPGAGPADGPLFLPHLHGKNHGGVGAPVPAVPCLRGACLADPGAAPQDPTPGGPGITSVGGETGSGQVRSAETSSNLRIDA
jgi:hypothetical protein